MKAKNLTIGLVGSVLLFVSAGIALADTVMLSATADASVYKWRNTVGEGYGAADYSYGYDDILKIRWHGLADSHKAYIKFTLPADFGTATSATVKITLAGSSPGGYDYDIYGLKDNSSGQDWAEGTGNHSGDPASVALTWNNAPANNVSDGHQFTSDATSVLATGSISSSMGASDYMSFSSQALTDFINTDTDKVITFMISGHTDTTADPNFASRENTTYDGPILELTYTPVPEPASIVILSSLIGMAFRQRF